MTKPDLAAIRERCEKATPGPWEVVKGKSFGVQSENKNIASCFRNENEDFIANARADIPALLGYIAKLEAVVGVASGLMPYHDENIDDSPTFYQHEVGMYVENQLKPSIDKLDGEETP